MNLYLTSSVLRKENGKKRNKKKKREKEEERERERENEKEKYFNCIQIASVYSHTKL